MLFTSIYYTFIYWLIFNLVYYLSSLVLFLIDYYFLFRKQKIQKKNWDYIMDTYKLCLIPVLVNSFFFAVFPTFVLSIFQNILNLEFSYLRMFINIILGTLLTDVFFFHGHKLLHHPKLYKHFHKKHHEITSPIGFSALYMTVVDLYVGNIFPVFIPMIIISAHPYTIMVWIFMTTFNTVFLAHSGFKHMAEFHDYHHKNFNKNFGTDVFMDRIYGTYFDN